MSMAGGGWSVTDTFRATLIRHMRHGRRTLSREAYLEQLYETSAKNEVIAWKTYYCGLPLVLTLSMAKHCVATPKSMPPKRLMAPCSE
jgi:hypothetical protein